MREIEFRGKKASDEQWKTGSLAMEYIDYEIDKDYINTERETYSICEFASGLWEEVLTETVGQYIGLKDKNGVKIFEGDVIALNADKSSHCLIKWLIDGWAAIFRGGGYREISFSNEKYEIIGNVHDNPKLFKEANND